MDLSHCQRILRSLGRRTCPSATALQEVPGFDNFHVFVAQAAAIAGIEIAVKGVLVAAYKPHIPVVPPVRCRASKAANSFMRSKSQLSAPLRTVELKCHLILRVRYIERETSNDTARAVLKFDQERRHNLRC